jgi:hypothetical protein
VTAFARVYKQKNNISYYLMEFSSVVYAFVLLNLVDGALVQKPNVNTLQQRGDLISRDHESGDGFIFCDTYEEKWTNWSTHTIQDGWALIHGCSYESEVCATLSYELFDENTEYGEDFMDLMVTKGDSCASNLDVPFDDREHHIQMKSPVSSSGKDIGLPASKTFCVIVVCNNDSAYPDLDYSCDKIKFRMEIATQTYQGAAAVSSSASTNFLLNVFLTVIPLATLLL